MTPKEQWVQALRSGEYEQGFGQLRYEDTYCVIGVGYDVIGTGWKEARYAPHGTYIPDTYHPIHELGSKMEIARWDLDTIIMLNDTYRYSFSQLADHIESLDSNYREIGFNETVNRFAVQPEALEYGESSGDS